MHSILTREEVTACSITPIGVKYYMRKYLREGTLALIGLSLLLTIVTMCDKGPYLLSVNNWDILLWSLFPYAVCSALLLKSVKTTPLSFIGSVVFLFVTTATLIDSLYFSYRPKLEVVYMLLSFMQLLIIGAYLFIVLIVKIVTLSKRPQPTPKSGAGDS